jgi:nucleotide-binding universal stress UspA family protein
VLWHICLPNTTTRRISDAELVEHANRTATAESLGCDLLIKGAYTQSRLRQMIFGGATRHMLANASLPVVMAH